MNINSERAGGTVILSLSGRLDTASSPLLERKIKQLGEEVEELILNFADLTYVSSAGLRVMLQTQKNLKQQGRKFSIENMNTHIREVFEMTGFINLMVKEEKFVTLKKQESNHFTFTLIGRMAGVNVPSLKNELAHITSLFSMSQDAVLIDLDVGRLFTVTEDACSLLKTALSDTAWSKRTVSFVNANTELKDLLIKRGLEMYFSNGNEKSA